MPENIEPTNPEETAEEITALQEVQAEDEDVQAHNTAPVGGGGGAEWSSISVAACY